MAGERTTRCGFLHVGARAKGSSCWQGGQWPVGVQSVWPGARRPGLRARLLPGLVCALVARSSFPSRLWVVGPEERRTAKGLTGDDLAGGRKGRKRRDWGER